MFCKFDAWEKISALNFFFFFRINLSGKVGSIIVQSPKGGAAEKKSATTVASFILYAPFLLQESPDHLHLSSLVYLVQSGCYHQTSLHLHLQLRLGSFRQMRV